jgi:NAD+ kinase
LPAFILYNAISRIAMAQLQVKHRSIAIMSKPAKPALARLIPEIIDWLKARNYRVVIDRETSVYCQGVESISREDFGRRTLDYVLLLGGDGTLLSAARALGKTGIPVLGVNLGTLGFLAEVTLDNLYPALDAAEQGKATVEQRAMLHCTIERGEQGLASQDALNEVVVGKNNVARLNNFDLHIDNMFVSAFRADGIIVSTPTGSTAYSLAAGGPILTPAVDAFVITPVSAHSLTHRPLVVPDTSEIVVTVKNAKEDAFVSFDGQLGQQAIEGDRIRCRRSERSFNLVRLQSKFFDVLRTKLKWGLR